MSTCSIYREKIVELSLNTLDDRLANALREHLGHCADCQQYLFEITGTRDALNAVQIRSDIETSEAFHRRIAAQINREETASPLQNILLQLASVRANWKLAFSLVGATALIAVGLVIFVAQSGDRATPKPSVAVKTESRTNRKAELAPTVGNYQMIANQSLEKLDELLMEQGNRRQVLAPLYTASATETELAP